MLTIRLQRMGTKNKPSFRIVLAEAHRAAGKRALEVLGNYNPRNKELGIRNKERLDYWINQHVSVSPTVHNLLVEKKIIVEKKIKAWRPKKKQAEETALVSPAMVVPVPQAAPDEALAPAIKAAPEAPVVA